MINKIYTAVILLFLLSCNQQENKQAQTTIPVTVNKTVTEDTVVTKLKPIILNIEKNELRSTNTLLQILVDSVQYKMISLKDYYQIQKEELTKSMRFSTNKDKTNKALEYLDQMIHSSAVTPDIYRVQFFLTAELANNIHYHENHVKYLKPDMTEIRILFP
jgi:hypothetical protein